VTSRRRSRLILNIVGIVLGWLQYGIGSTLGIIGLVFTIIAMSSKAQDPMGARGKGEDRPHHGHHLARGHASVSSRCSWRSAPSARS